MYTTVNSATINAFSRKVTFLFVLFFVLFFDVSASPGGKMDISKLLEKLSAISGGAGGNEQLYSTIFYTFDYSRDFGNLITIASDATINIDQRLDALVVLAPLAEVSNSREHFSDIANLLNSSESVDIVTQQAMFISFVYMVLARVDEDKTFEICKERFVRDFWTEDKVVTPLPNDITMEEAVDLLRATSISGMARVGNENAIEWIEKVNAETPKSSDPLEPLSMTLRDAKTFLIDADKKLRELTHRVYRKIHGSP